jgi:lipopolysaccharide transport system ATP-binding protein
MGGLRSLFSRNGATPKRNDTFWALKDVSLEIKQGEVVGIIGRNGAGESTLLKVLSRITEPTAGFADIRVAVGGRHRIPRRADRENIYLNGAILGMKKRKSTANSTRSWISRLWISLEWKDSWIRQ